MKYSSFAIALLVGFGTSQTVRGADFDCKLPEEASEYSIATLEDAAIGAHNMYKGMCVTGALTDTTPDESAAVDNTKSYIGSETNDFNTNWNGGVEFGDASSRCADMWPHLEYLAKNAESSEANGKKVVVVTECGEYNLYDFNNGGQGYDKGNTLVIFNCAEDVILDKTSDGRQFGPSVLAPFADVYVKGDAGFVDGTIWAKNIETTGSNDGSLQLHGDTYDGPIECGVATTEEPATTTEEPDTTTEEPATTTEEPATTTEEPATTTEEPATTTEEPDTTTEEPATTTEEPDTTTEEPATTTEDPATTTKEPDTTTDEPDPAPPEPETTEEPPATTEAPPDTTEAPPTGSTSGDPHFTMFSGEKFDFHGACDLVFLSNPEYNNGQGMRIHIRTKQVRWWSYVESAVIQIGNETLEVRGGLGSSDYWINGNKGPKNIYSGVLDETLAGHNIRYRVLNDITFQYKVFLNGQSGLGSEAVVLRSVKDWMKIDLQHHSKKNFGTSIGLLGDYETGKKMGRDGVTTFASTDAFGLEWQVHDDEPMLFHDIQGAQYPEQCSMPAVSQRRLGEQTIGKEAAGKACVHVNKRDLKDCIFDVMASGDPDMAAVY